VDNNPTAITSTITEVIRIIDRRRPTPGRITEAISGLPLLLEVTEVLNPQPIADQPIRTNEAITEHSRHEHNQQGLIHNQHDLPQHDPTLLPISALLPQIPVEAPDRVPLADRVVDLQLEEKDDPFSYIKTQHSDEQQIDTWPMHLHSNNSSPRSK
jgi:hypothetical protein